MLPRTIEGENTYRKKKRKLEIESIIFHVKKYLRNNSYTGSPPLKILEFGCGNGFQIPYLEKLGVVTATDIFISNNLNIKEQTDFVKCDISNSPFLKDQFDLIFSNHVIEHIRDLNKALDELKRIGKRNCLYALSVPTNVWLLLSIPAQYLQKVRAMVKQIKRSDKNDHSSAPKKKDGFDLSYTKNNSFLSILFDKIKPHGHGSIKDFLKCYQSFKKDSWYKLFNQHGFNVITTQSLLLYAPSEWPIIPIISVKGRAKICSSLLYLIAKT